MFYITAAVFILGLIVLLLLGRAEEEEWAKKQKENYMTEENVPLKDQQNK